MAQVTAIWQREDLLLEGETDTGNRVVMDSSPGAGGKNRGPRPMQMILMGLAGCTAMDVISILQKKREPLQDLQVVVTAEQAEGHPKVFTKFHIEYIVRGAVNEKSLQRAIELSEQTYCPAQAMLRQAAPISTSYRIEAAA